MSAGPTITFPGQQITFQTYCPAHGLSTGATCPNCFGIDFTFVPTASQAEVDALKLRVAAVEARLAALEKTP